MINVACNIDNNYIVRCCTMLTSLFFNNRDRDIRVYVISEGLTDEAQQHIQTAALSSRH